ncbi:MAG: hypothetical protein ACD_28C00323G0003 [uncultured bacterium]|nr:MAG: hypothetical protein ACD_28C00323G0003 [uncultured bacterium]
MGASKNKLPILCPLHLRIQSLFNRKISRRIRSALNLNLSILFLEAPYDQKKS